MSTFEAYRMVMIQIKCDFCDENDEDGVAFITPSYDRLYGVQACPNCTECGKNALEASLDKIGAVDCRDFHRISEIKIFTDFLKNEDFPVVRTNGEVEFDWRLDSTSPIMKYEKGWSFKVQKNDNEKLVYINKFIENCNTEIEKTDDESKKSKMRDLISSCVKVLEILNNGFYGTLFEEKHGFRF